MSFRDALEKVVRRATGGVGAVFVDGEGETIELYARGGEDLKLVGAHHGIILHLVRQALERIGTRNQVESIVIRSGRLSFALVPVHDDTFVVLVQNLTGLPSQGTEVLKEAAGEILLQI